MATHRPVLSDSADEFAGLLLAQRELNPRAEVIASQTAVLFPGVAVNVYIYDEDTQPSWSVRATVGDIAVHQPIGPGTLTVLAARREALIFSGGELAREEYAHLDVRRTVVSLAYVPILLDDLLIGAIEIVSFDQRLAAEDLEAVDELCELSAVALAAAQAYENERNTNLDSITRLAQLYDVERVFNSTLEMGDLMPLITAKIRELLNTQAVNLWMVQEDDLVLMSRDGVDNTVELDRGGDEIIKQVADSGEAVLIGDPGDERLQRRNGSLTEGAITSLAAVPVLERGGSLVGVLECINKDDGSPLDDDDLFFLTTISETAAGALHNASLMEAEKKIEILETLVEVSSEITSTLNLERVLQVVVNGPQRIMRYDRAAVALEQKGKLQVKAISGKTEIVQSDPEVRKLREMLEYSAIFDKDLWITVKNEMVQADREETKAKFAKYFIDTGSRAWYAVPLADDQGRLGILAFESTDPEFLGETQFEFIKVLASQATVAVRNAGLYAEVPLIGVLEPILQRKRQFLAMEKRRRGAVIALAVAAVLFLVAFPLPMRVAGDAVVAAQSTAKVQAEVEGVVHKVYVREGEHVTRGTVLADLDDWDYRAALAGAEAKHAIALAAMNRALASNDGSEAGIQRVQADYWASEVKRAEERLERTKLRSSIDGVVATPHMETLAGRQLKVGDTLAEVVNSARAVVDVAVEGDDVPLLQAGEGAAVKLESFPTRKFRGQVAIVSPVSVAEQDHRIFYARVDVPNPQGLIRPGMQGQSKIWVGWRPAGYVFFRGIGMWMWSKVWSWFGW
jgi:RND family efflux transporter MFP subunit